MPTYDYVCQACGHVLEIFQSMSEGPKRKCPQCGALRLKRQIGSGAGIVFKGSGFYQTDYRSKSYHEARQRDEKGASSPSAGDSAAGAGDSGNGKSSASEGGQKSSGSSGDSGDS